MLLLLLPRPPSDDLLLAAEESLARSVDDLWVIISLGINFLEAAASVPRRVPLASRVWNLESGLMVSLAQVAPTWRVNKRRELRRNQAHFL